MQAPPTPMVASDKGAVLSVCHSKDGRLLASAGQGGEIQVLDVESGETVHVLVGFGESISSVCFSPRGNLLASAERRDASIRLWDLSLGSRPRDPRHAPQEVRCMHAQHFGGVNCVAFSCEGSMLLAAYGNVSTDLDVSDPTMTLTHTSNAVMVWDTASGTLRMQIADGHNGAITTVACCPSTPRFAASGSIDGSIRVWDVLEGKEDVVITGHAGAVWSVCYSPEGSTIASASSDRTVRVWSASTGDSLLIIRGHAKVVTSVQMTTDGTKLLSCSSDRTVRLWDASSGAELACAEGDGAFTAVSVGSGFNVAVGCASGELYLLDMAEAAESSSPHRGALSAPRSSPPQAANRAASQVSPQRRLSDLIAQDMEALRKAAALKAAEEMDRIRTEQDEQLSRIKQEQLKQMSDLALEHNQQLAQIHDQHQAKLATLHDEHQNTLAQLQASQEAVLAQVKDGYEEVMRTLREEHESQVDALSEEHRLQVQALHAQHDMELTSLRNQMAEDLQKEKTLLEEEHVTAVEEEDVKLRAEREALVQDMRKTSREELEELKARLMATHDAEKERLTSDADAALRLMREESESEIARVQQEAKATVERLKENAELETRTEVERVRAVAQEERERRSREVKEQEYRKGAEEREDIVVQLRASLKAELDKALAGVAVEHERGRAEVLERYKEESNRELDVMLAEAAKFHQARLAEARTLHHKRLEEALAEAKDKYEEDMHAKIQAELKTLGEALEEEAKRKCGEARKEHEARTEEEIQVLLAEWRVADKERIKHRIAQEKEAALGAEPPALDELREVFESRAARHMSYTMQLVRDWASLEEDGQLKALYDECTKEQHSALQGVRELYVSQLQRMAEALLTRVPPPPDELVDIVERAMKAVMTAHRHTRTAVDGDEQAQRLLHLESMNAAEWIHECAKEEVDAQSRHPDSRTHNGTYNGRAQASLGEFIEGSADEGTKLKGMIKALRSTPGSNLASAVSQVRRQMASEMAELLMDDEQYARHIISGAAPSPMEAQETIHHRGVSMPRGTPKRRVVSQAFAMSEDGSDDDDSVGWGVSLPYRTMFGYSGRDTVGDMRHTLTERFRYLEPSPDIHSSLVGFLTPRRTSSRDVGDAKSEPRLQIPSWMKHYRQAYQQRHQADGTKRAASNLKREKLAGKRRGEALSQSSFDAEHLSILQRMTDRPHTREEEGERHDLPLIPSVRIVLDEETPFLHSRSNAMDSFSMFKTVAAVGRGDASVQTQVDFSFQSQGERNVQNGNAQSQGDGSLQSKGDGHVASQGDGSAQSGNGKGRLIC